ncbi:MAG: Cobalamin biosynthesis protein CbiG [Methanothrix sp.]|jgi:cobalt-precorrin 5A hydrolase|nr:MAG: Cobalamin biosynthesis protein CbiG [Methanothrix sp.]
MAVGIVVRMICPALADKWTGTPVVAVDSSLRSAVPVVGGHHGGNDLAFHLFEKLGVYPAITTATDAAGRPSLEGTAAVLGARIVNRSSSKDVNLAFLREEVPVVRLAGPKVVLVGEGVAVLKSKGGVVVGIGARRGVEASEVVEAVRLALASVGRGIEEIRAIATGEIKRDEPGICEAAERLGHPVIYLDGKVLNSQSPTTASRASSLGLVGVAEPAALALSERLIMPKKAYGRVTVALGE